jgi:aerobic C4-dicarboxylate transport protein
VIGVILGHFWPATGEAMKPLGDAFIKLIKMIIAPIIFCTVVVGIAGMEDMKKVGKTGGLALLYFEIVSSVALIVGLVVINLVQPGSGMNIDPASLDTKGIAAYTKPGQMQGTVDFLLAIIPATVVDAFAKGEILQVLLFSVLFGFALHKFGGRGTLVFSIVGIIMKAAPIGAFGAMAFTIGKYGVGSLLSLGKLMATFYATCLIFIFVVLGLIARVHGFSVWEVHQVHQGGVADRAGHLVVGIGAAAHDGQAGEPGRAQVGGGAGDSHRLFVQPGWHVDLPDDGRRVHRAGHQHADDADAAAHAAGRAAAHEQRRRRHHRQRLHRAGGHAVGGGRWAVGGVPVAGLALILGIDRFMSEARALTNLIGNGVATVVVAKWTNDLDTTRMQRQLDGETDAEAEAEEPEQVLDQVEQHMPAAR